MNAKTTKLTKRHEKANHLTTHEAKHAHASRTLHGKPYDQRRLGKLGENVFVPGFENFYIAGSECKMRYGTYDIMQAPIAAHEDKVDTVKDFWDTVVVMRRSPIIVTTHDPPKKKCQNLAMHKERNTGLPIGSTLPCSFEEAGSYRELARML